MCLFSCAFLQHTPPLSIIHSFLSPLFFVLVHLMEEDQKSEASTAPARRSVFSSWFSSHCFIFLAPHRHELEFDKRISFSDLGHLRQSGSSKEAPLLPYQVSPGESRVLSSNGSFASVSSHLRTPGRLTACQPCFTLT